MKKSVIFALVATAIISLEFSNQLNSQNVFLISTQGQTCITCDTVKPKYDDPEPQKTGETNRELDLFDQIAVHLQQKQKDTVTATLSIKMIVFNGILMQFDKGDGVLKNVESIELVKPLKNSSLKIFTIYTNLRKISFSLRPIHEYRKVSLILEIGTNITEGDAYIPGDEKNGPKYKDIQIIKLKI